MQTPMLIVSSLFAIIAISYPVTLLVAFMLEKNPHHKVDAFDTIRAWRDLVFYKPYVIGVIGLGLLLLANGHSIQAAAVVVGFWISQAIAQWSIVYYSR